MIAGEETTENYKSRAAERANEILIGSRAIRAFPFDCFSLIQELGKEVAIEAKPFSWIEEQGMNAEDVVLSEDAETFEMGEMYLIFYNQEMPQARLTFSMAHEIGHIVLGHDMERVTGYRKAEDPRHKALYDRYESEANYFASCLLMPEPVINRLRSLGCGITAAFLKEKFGVSGAAADVRIGTLRRNSRRYVSYWDKDKSLEDALLVKFEGFIRNIAPRMLSYDEECRYEEEMQAERDRWLAEGY